MGRLSDMRRKRDEEAKRRRNASGTASTPLTDPTSPLYIGYHSTTSYTSYDSGSNCDSGSYGSSSYDSGSSSSSSDCGGGNYGE